MKYRIPYVILLILLAPVLLYAGDIRGKVIDARTQEPLIGATVRIVGKTDKGAMTSMDGTFVISNVGDGTHSILVTFVSYKPFQVDEIIVPQRGEELIIPLESDDTQLSEVSVVRSVRRNTANTLLAATRQSLLVQSGVSAQEITRTQDSNAGEVLRRVPGMSLIDEKFVMVRGLSQRYNNVWINGSSVPSSEADSRAFSFDILPAGQLDNLQVIKSPAPEYPADFSGGFVLIKTKDFSDDNSFRISTGGEWNTLTHFQDFKYSKGSKTDFLGFDGGLRSIDEGFGRKFNMLQSGLGIDLRNNGLNNDWELYAKKPIGDGSLNMDFNYGKRLDSGARFGIMGAFNYKYGYRTITDMVNSLYGAYDVARDKSIAFRDSRDNQYTTNVKVGGMLNITYGLSNGDRIEWRNIVNQLGKDRYTNRHGYDSQSNEEQSAEYFYSSRTIYSSQLSGKTGLGEHEIDWSLGYAYANKMQPDRRRYTLNDQNKPGVITLTTGNDIYREFSKLNEHTGSVNLNWKNEYEIGDYDVTFKAGSFGEYRYRDYRQRELIYAWNTADNDLPPNFTSMDFATELMKPQHFGDKGLYLLEDPKFRSNYKGKNTLGAGYLSAKIPVGPLDIYGGVRYEYNVMELIQNTRDDQESPISTFLKDGRFFPSILLTYHINDDHQVRGSFGTGINRPEFREISASSYYDFDLASFVKGNPDLKSADIINGDLRYEWYPRRGELLSVALFYKKFHNPIEWTYVVQGGTDLQYSYENADNARSFGAEVEVRKELDQIGLKNLSLSMNASWIDSKVMFDEKSREKDRPMQGQSPYLINLGIYYIPHEWDLSLALMYNRIGKRIVGVGRSEGAIGSDDLVNIPDSYEMPRDLIDFSVSKKWGNLEVKASVKDILAQKVRFMQFDNVTLQDGQQRDVQQVVKEYRPGQTFRLSISYQL